MQSMSSMSSVISHQSASSVINVITDLTCPRYPQQRNICQKIFIREYLSYNICQRIFVLTCPRYPQPENICLPQQSGLRGSTKQLAQEEILATLSLVMMMMMMMMRMMRMRMMIVVPPNSSRRQRHSRHWSLSWWWWCPIVVFKSMKSLSLESTLWIIQYVSLAHKGGISFTWVQNISSLMSDRTSSHFWFNELRYNLRNACFRFRLLHVDYETQSYIYTFRVAVRVFTVA